MYHFKFGDAFAGGVCKGDENHMKIQIKNGKTIAQDDDYKLLAEELETILSELLEQKVVPLELEGSSDEADENLLSVVGVQTAAEALEKHNSTIAVVDLGGSDSDCEITAIVVPPPVRRRLTGQVSQPLPSRQMVCWVPSDSSDSDCNDDQST